MPAYFQDLKKQEHTYPPSKHLSARPEVILFILTYLSCITHFVIYPIGPCICRIAKNRNVPIRHVKICLRDQKYDLLSIPLYLSFIISQKPKIKRI